MTDFQKQSQAAPARPNAVPGPEATPQAKGGAFDEHSRQLFWRFVEDWVLPRWRQMLWALLLMACLAAVTGGYPMIIKASFDTLMADNGASLLVVLGAIITITMLRSIFLYLQTVATQRIVTRMSTDIQKSAFTQHHQCRLRAVDPGNAGAAAVAPDQ